MHTSNITFFYVKLPKIYNKMGGYINILSKQTNKQSREISNISEQKQINYDRKQRHLQEQLKKTQDGSHNHVTEAPPTPSYMCEMYIKRNETLSEWL